MHIMNSTAQKSSDHKEAAMNEKIYKAMSRSGVSNLIIGIILIATGVGCGILAIISGARLLKRRGEITF